VIDSAVIASVFDRDANAGIDPCRDVGTLLDQVRAVEMDNDGDDALSFRDDRVEKP
jgi:hypothetical protein